MDDPHHRCRSLDRCVGITPDGSAITSKPATICNGCVKQLQDYLEQLPVIRDALRSFLGVSPTTSQGSKVNSTPEPSVPINLRALDLMDEIDEVVRRAGNVAVADLINRPAEKFTLWRRGRMRETYLDGVERALYIRACWRKADQIIGLSRTWQRRHIPCPKCSLPTLGQWSGEDAIHCSNADCAISFPRNDYDKLVLDEHRKGKK
ncbi:hypothetical protein A5747_13620 [Mycobacterium sp. IS-836]|nr:hypothetical protein A5747_13620 [Mycobacterium sp. IS-836]